MSQVFTFVLTHRVELNSTGTISRSVRAKVCLVPCEMPGHEPAKDIDFRISRVLSTLCVVWCALPAYDWLGCGRAHSNTCAFFSPSGISE